MRRPIDTAPRNGEDIWVEDATGAVEVAFWSSKTGKRVWKDGSPIDNAPTHWYPATEDVDPEDEPSGRPFAVAVILIPVIVVGAALLGALDPFSAQTIPNMTRTGGESVLSLDQRPDIASGSQAVLQHEVTGALMLAVPVSMVRLDEDAPRSVALAGELTGARRELEIAELRQSLQQERERSAVPVAEAKAAQPGTANAEQQRRAFE